MSQPVPAGIEASAVEAVRRLGEQVVMGRYRAALERMNPEWKKRTATRMGGMAALEKRLDAVAAEMVRQGITMISSAPEGKPSVHEVSPELRRVTLDGISQERMVFTKWLVLVPTRTRFQIIAEGNPRPIMIENMGFQVAITDKEKIDWSFIDGSGLTAAELRGLFITLPPDIKLPEVGKREVQ
ncbi:MAG: hypothetical protein ACO3RV_06095 [Luteolibacter sp.]